MAQFTVRVVVGFLAVVVAIAFPSAIAEGAAWYEALKKWQTGLGAFAGLLAILFGAFYNADLARKSVQSHFSYGMSCRPHTRMSPSGYASPKLPVTRSMA